MFKAIFSFRGRINRLQFLLRWLGVTAALFVVVSIGFLTGLKVGPIGALVSIVILIAALAYLWASLSLQARRFRDIGWNPVLIIPGWFALRG